MQVFGLIIKRRIVCLCLLLPLPLCAHSTNGHFCTEITEPIRCFNSEGFCEWAFAQCLYRCDIHDDREDCEQIKDGCSWQGEACVPDPVEMEMGTDMEMASPDATTDISADGAVPTHDGDLDSTVDDTSILDISPDRAPDDSAPVPEASGQCMHLEPHPLSILASLLFFSLWRVCLCS